MRPRSFLVSTGATRNGVSTQRYVAADSAVATRSSATPRQPETGSQMYAATMISGQCHR